MLLTKAYEDYFIEHDIHNESLRPTIERPNENIGYVVGNLDCLPQGENSFNATAIDVDLYIMKKGEPNVIIHGITKELALQELKNFLGYLPKDISSTSIENGWIYNTKCGYQIRAITKDSDVGVRVYHEPMREGDSALIERLKQLEANREEILKNAIRVHTTPKRQEESSNE